MAPLARSIGALLMTGSLEPPAWQSLVPPGRFAPVANLKAPCSAFEIHNYGQLLQLLFFFKIRHESSTLGAPLAAATERNSNRTPRAYRRTPSSQHPPRPGIPGLKGKAVAQSSPSHANPRQRGHRQGWSRKTSRSCSSQN